MHRLEGQGNVQLRRQGKQRRERAAKKTPRVVMRMASSTAAINDQAPSLQLSGQAKRLAPHGPGRLDETPAWFPDGKRIAFQSDRAGAFDVWIMGVDGSGERQITH